MGVIQQKITLLATLFLLFNCSKKQEQINIFSSRHYDIDQKLYEKFEEKTGIKVNLTKGNADELIFRLENEKELAAADLFVAVDAGKLMLANEKKLFQSLDLPELEENIPAHLIGENWVAFTKRARVFAFMKKNVNKNVKNYEDLANPLLQGKLLIRSSDNSYNRDLMAALISHWGEEKAIIWAKNIVKNLAREPKGGDRDQIKAMASGEGEIALSNSYYIGKLIHSSNPQEAEIGAAVQVVFPNQENTGTHININGCGILKTAKNVENARKLILFLTSKEVQEFLSANNFEYPVRKDADLPELLKSWGEFKEDVIDFNEILKNTKTAVSVFEAADWK